MADGILTPAVSVTSAAAGIAVARPSAADKITGISLVGIFPSFLPFFSVEDRTGLPHPPFPRATFRYIKAGFRVCT